MCLCLTLSLCFLNTHTHTHTHTNWHLPFYALLSLHLGARSELERIFLRSMGTPCLNSLKGRRRHAPVNFSTTLLPWVWLVLFDVKVASEAWRVLLGSREGGGDLGRHRTCWAVSLTVSGQRQCCHSAASPEEQRTGEDGSEHSGQMFTASCTFPGNEFRGQGKADDWQRLLWWILKMSGNKRHRK